MDVQMPEMNGIDAVKFLRGQGHTLPVIAVTANALKEEREECLQAGMNDFLTKPFRVKDLVPILKKWLPEEATAESAQGAGHGGGEASAAQGRGEPSAQDVFNFAEAVRAFMDQKDIVIRVMRQYLQKVQSQLLSMKQSIDGGAWDSLRIESHGIKGGGWNLQAKALGDVAAVLEKAAIARDAKAARQALNEVKKEYERLAAHVAELPEFV
jgi:CheY-like chemotaxis protein